MAAVMLNLLAGRYEYQRHLGSGSFGEVRLYRDVCGPPQSVVAIKSIPFAKILQESQRLIREIDIMLFLRDRHPHVVNCFHIFATSDAQPSVVVPVPEGGELLSETEQADRAVTCLRRWLDTVADIRAKVEEATQSGGRGLRVDHVAGTPSSFSIHFVLPFMNGDIERFIGQYKRNGLWGAQAHLHRGVGGVGGGIGGHAEPWHAPDFVGTTIAVVAFQVLFGMDFLHKSAIIHRDLKPENILLRLDNVNAYCTSAIVADFGLACMEADAATFYVCTRTYRPPELIVARSSALPSIDVWSLGCILYELVTGDRLIDIPSSRDRQTGEWSGTQAAGQLELVMDVVGTPTPEAVREFIPDDTDPVKSYLLKTRPRPSRVRDLMLARISPAQMKEDTRELWIDLVLSCLRFFPEERPTAEDLCKHALFRSFGMDYGGNVTQCEAARYESRVVISSRPEKNVLTVLSQVADHLSGEISDTVTSPPMQPITTPAILPNSGEQPSAAAGAARTVSFPFLRTEEVVDKYASMPLRSLEDVLDATDSCEFDYNDAKERLRAAPDDTQLQIRLEDLHTMLNYLSKLVNWDEGGGDEEDEDC